RRNRANVAREAFDRALALDPRLPKALVGAATVLYRQGNYTESIARFEAAQSADPHDLEASLGVAMASLAAGRPADARSVLVRLATEHGNNARVHYWLAKALMATSEPAQAEREFREAIRLDPGD